MSKTDLTESAVRRSRSTRRRWLFSALLAGAVWLFCEGISWIGLTFVASGWSRVAAEREGVANPGNTVPHQEPSEDIVHPYLGFVRRPRSASEARLPIGVSEFGFPDNESPLAVRQPDEMIIAVLGGSVAEEFARSGWATLQEQLQNSELFRTKRLRIVRLGLSGYKQPQQLLLVNYLLVLGAEFDVVVNLDGFNEVALPDVENIPNQVYAAFPRGWQVRVMDTNDKQVLRKVGRLAAIKEADQFRAQTFGRAPWRWSPTASVLWLYLNRLSEEQEFQAHAALQAAAKRREVSAALGPRQSFDSQDSLFRHCAVVWKNSSRQLHATCRQRSIRYLHFLQPNQYLPGSKPRMDREELRRFVKANYPGRTAVEQGYPLLQQAGQELIAEGVEFHDLTQLFLETEEATYRDECCHLNDTGNDLVAKRIAEALIRQP